MSKLHLPPGYEEPDENEQAKTMYATYGAAVYFSSCLEYGLINVLATAEVLEAKKTGKVIADDPWERRVQDKKLTMGALITQVKNGGHLSVAAGLQKELYDALEVRNFLAHHFWRERSDEAMSVRGQAKLIAELEGNRQMFDKANKRVDAEVMGPMMVKMGITPDMQSAMYNQMLREAKEKHG
ncbi:hypothetical protein ABZT48_05180 [Streptomyces avermitilis]|uniref:hypothetical protein n=1 Tax=Streptomyces avermitilis TaxID=33903 RepID=UPI0033A2134F